LASGNQALNRVVVQGPAPEAEYLLYFFLPKHDRESIPCSLEEEYRNIILPKFGRRKADWWYWKEVVCSIAPLIWPLLKKVLLWLLAGKLASKVWKVWLE